MNTNTINLTSSELATISGGLNGGTVFEAIGGAIGSYFGPWGAAAGTIIGSAIWDYRAEIAQSGYDSYNDFVGGLTCPSFY